VLGEFFEPVQKAHPDARESYLAIGELALEKSDFSLAGKSFSAATKKFPEDPDAWFGLARAYSNSDAETTEDALEKTLKFNPHHTGAKLLRADHYIDAEDYAAADAALAEALKINPHHPEAHAYRAVLAHLRGDSAAEAEARTAAFAPSATNPRVPHLIGRKLSQKYRFAEGAALQREALRFDREFLPAKAQLANDLLRLGEEEEGWRLAEQVHQEDPYDVVAYNLTTMREAIAHFETLTSEHFKVKMDPQEAKIYGDDVLALLERAHATLSKKYGLQMRGRTTVEIFPKQSDFAIRTFGLPGGGGYLGVCFGNVVTVNSPASRQSSPANWEAILWHEFAHVVTLTLTKNKMPRWLSEGISVYEERLARGSWGEQMKPRYRAMILGEDLTPLSGLSGAFLKPKTPMHIGFAYYESSLAVEWLTQRWGMDKMKRLLADLAAGREINAALAAHFAPIETLDSEFATHARQLATGTAPKLDWAKPPPATFASDDTALEWIKKNPDNFTALTEHAKQLITEKKWAEAKAPLLRLIALYPEQRAPDSAYAQLAKVHRALGESDAELTILRQHADLAADAPETYERLMELSSQRGEWTQVIEYARRFRAVNPLRPTPYRFEAEALEATKAPAAAAQAYRTLLQLDPQNPSPIHYRLARVLHAAGDKTAKRHVLKALEETPRFQEAQTLLLEITGNASPDRAGKPPKPR
jgi:tetratricopeptide (TPR) repeat protein